MILFSFCSCHWLLPWLLPFLLGLLAGWALWARFKGMVADLEARVSSLNGKVSGLESDLSACGKARSEIDGDLSMTKGRLRELEGELAACKKAAEKAKQSGSSTKPSGGSGKEKYSAGSKSAGSNAGSITSNLSGSGSTTKSGSESESGSSTGSGDAGKKSIYAGLKQDNLQIIEGVGPKMESILKENGVNSLSELAGKSTSDVQAILDKYGDKYKIIDPKTWVQQSGLAAGGKWEELIDLQKRLDTGRDNAVGMTDSKLEKILIKSGAIVSFKQDDLKAIEGIGPAIEKLMHAAGVMNWRDMANSSVEKLKGILDDAGSRFKLADPGSWPKQAEMAADGKFQELQEYQDFLDGGK